VHVLAPVNGSPLNINIAIIVKELLMVEKLSEGGKENLKEKCIFYTVINVM